MKSTQNIYSLFSCQFDIGSLKLLIATVRIIQVYCKAKNTELVEKICSLDSENRTAGLKRNLCVERQIKPVTEKMYLIVDIINDAINASNNVYNTTNDNHTIIKHKKLR